MATEYVVLRQLGPEDEKHYERWVVHNESCVAASAEAAIRISIADKDEAVYVAVPKRSWAPAKVSIETTTRIKIAEAG